VNEMCLAVPGRVTEIKGKTAVVEIMGALREASLELLEDVQIGDYVILHAGCAIEKLDEAEALKTIELFKELKDIYHA